MLKLALTICALVVPLISHADTFDYTFSDSRNSAISFTLSEPSILTPGVFTITPFVSGGFTYTQAELGDLGSGELCFYFATSGVTGDCSTGGATPLQALTRSFFRSSLNAPGSYSAFATQAVNGDAPNRLVITQVASPVPEPPAIFLLSSVFAGVSLLRRRKLAQKYHS